MRSLVIATFRGHRRRMVGTGLAVVMGVAFLAATLVLADTLRAGFGDAFAEANRGTDAVVRSAIDLGDDESGRQRGLLDESLAGRVGAIDGVAAAVPSIEGVGQIVGADGDPLGGDGPPTIAGNWIGDPQLNPYRIVEGRAPAGGGEVVIDRGSAVSGRLAVGDRTTVLTPRPVPVTVVGIATFGSLDTLGGTTFAGFATPAAQELLLGQEGRVTDILVRARPGVDQETLVARIAAALPDGAEAITGAQLTAEQEDAIQDDFLGFFETLLLVFAGVALLVTVFSINNTFTILVAQRGRESALVRALGATRRQVLGAVAVEALAVGLVASAAGLALGVGLAVLLAALLDAAMGLPAGAAVVGLDAALVSLSVGVVVTAAASLAPAVRASRVPPLAALRDVAIDRAGASRTRAVAGGVLTALGVALALAGASGGERALALGGAGAVLTLVGFVVLGPVVARAATAVIGGPIALLRGRTGSLAQRNAMRSPRRTAGTASALMIGVAVVTLFTVLASSLKASVDDSVSRSFGGDLVVATQAFSGAGIDPALAAALTDLPEVATAAGIGDAVVTIDGVTRHPVVAEPERLDAVLDLDVSEGDLAAVGDAGLAVSDDFARERGWEVGTRVPVTFADGDSVQLTVRALYGTRDILGDMVMSRAAWAPHATQGSDVAVLIGLADGVTLDAGREAVEAVADRFHAPDVQDREEFVATMAGQVDQMLGVIYALLGLAILIALMGIANTLSLSIHERTRELGLLRAVGQTRRQMRAMVRWESVIVAVFGALGGLGLGGFLGWAMVRAASEDGIGTFSLPVGSLSAIVLVAAGAGVLAALRPARRAARIDILRAVAAD